MDVDEPRCRKVLYDSLAMARQAADTIRDGRKLYPYTCAECGGVHLALTDRRRLKRELRRAKRRARRRRSD